MLEEIKESAEIFVCDCNSREHQIVFQYDFDDNYVYCHIHLSQYSFWKRVKVAIKYILGYKCKYGNWEEFIWNVDDAPKLEEMAKRLIKNKM
jgi:hypothetical protein